MKVLVTGVNGFVGRRLVPRLLSDGHEVTGGVGPQAGDGDVGCPVFGLDLADPAALDHIDPTRFDAVVHLAAVASSADARRAPARAWNVNTVGSVRLLEAFGESRAGANSDPVFLLVSTCDVYAPTATGVALDEQAPTEPRSVYAATKLAAEVAAGEVARRTGLRVVVARPFPHSGAGQDPRYVVPDFARKITTAMKGGDKTVSVGDLRVVRELLHVSDVVDAYARLLNLGGANGVYNIARGEGYSLGRVFDAVAVAVGYRPDPVGDEQQNGARVPYQVGDAGRLREATGWAPSKSFDDVISETAAAWMSVD